MTTNLVKMVLVLAVVAVGVSLKISRYAAAHTAIPTASLDRIVRTMAGHGWVLVSKAETATSTLYDHLSFQRRGCDATVTIAAMGGNAEAAEFFRQRYGGDAAFIQGGAVVERPSGVARQLTILTHHARTILRLPIEPVMPILAISPAPSQSECHGPPASAWRDLQMSVITYHRIPKPSVLRRMTMRKILTAFVFAAGLSAVTLTADAAPGGNGNGNAFGLGGGNAGGNGGGNGNGRGGGGGAPLPALGVTLAGQVVGLGGIFVLWRRRRNAKQKPTLSAS